MPHWDNDRFAQLEDRTIATLAGRSTLLEVPVYLFPYPPALELRCLKECDELALRLQAKGYSAEVHSLAEWFVDAVEWLGALEPEGIRQEIEHRDQVGEHLKREVPKMLSERMQKELGDKGSQYCAILVRAGALFPFAHVSNLLSVVGPRIHCTVVIAYPGGRSGPELRFLNETRHSYYRAEIV